MKQNVADFLVNRLLEWGIKRVFGLPGDGINGIMGAISRAQDKLEFIQVRHEEMAAFERTDKEKARRAASTACTAFKDTKMCVLAKSFK